MSSLLGRYFRLLHNLRHHIWGDVTIELWLILVLLVLALLFFFRVLPGGIMLAIVMLAVIVLLLASQVFARRRSYVLFQAEGTGVANESSGEALAPSDKVLLRASGEFTVEGTENRFTDLLAYYRTFETREHAVMARKTPSRFLGLGRERPETLGMWYMFFRPEDLSTVTQGRLHYGDVANPALRLHYQRINNKGKVKNSVAYLSFETERSRQQVLADLLADGAEFALLP